MDLELDRPDLSHATGVPGGPPALPPAPEPSDGGFDYWLLALLAGVALLVAIQNLWLRRRAERERARRDEP